MPFVSVLSCPLVEVDDIQACPCLQWSVPHVEVHGIRGAYESSAEYEFVTLELDGRHPAKFVGRLFRIRNPQILGHTSGVERGGMASHLLLVC